MTENTNPFYSPVKSEGGTVPVEQHRAIQEVQASMIIAKKFPRDQHAAFGRIMAACERKILAEAANYSYPKGGIMVSGPSIRLAEVMAQNWGNMEFGIKELSQGIGESEVQAFAWDLETNVRQSKTFKVPHRIKAKGSFKTLNDPREIYEHIANMGARRLRACILGVIPGDIVDAAVKKCDETLQKDDGKPLEDRIRDMLLKFKEIEISQELIEKRLQHKTSAIVRSQLVELGKIYNSIKDGMSKRSDWFDIPTSQQEVSSDLTDALKKNVQTGGLGPGELTKKPPESSEPSIPTEAKKDETPTGPDKPHPWDKDNWFRMRTGDRVKTGYAVFALKNLNTFGSASEETKKLAREKWHGFYKNEPFPPDQGASAGNENDDLIGEKYLCSECNQEFPSKDEILKHECQKAETPIEKFDRLCIECIQSHEDYGEPLLAHFLTKFIKSVAEVNEIDIEAVKMDASEDFVTFWTEFNTWLSKEDLTDFSPTGHKKPQETNISDLGGQNIEDLESKRMTMIDEIKNVGQRNAEVKRAAYDEVGVPLGAALSFFEITIVKNLYDTCLRKEKEFAM